MKLWIDDVRTPPDGTWFWAKTSAQALDYVYWHLDDLTHISFDHDLGGEDTSRPVARFLEQLVHNGYRPNIKMVIHSANPVGQSWLMVAIRNIERWSKR